MFKNESLILQVYLLHSKEGRYMTRWDKQEDVIPSSIEKTWRDHEFVISNRQGKNIISSFLLFWVPLLPLFLKCTGIATFENCLVMRCIDLQVPFVLNFLSTLM